jgi:hypothetical protein
MKSLDSMNFQKYLNKPDRKDQIRTSANASANSKLGQGFLADAAQMLVGCAGSNFVECRPNESGANEYAHEFHTGPLPQRTIARSPRQPILERDEPSNENPMTERDKNILTSPRGTMGQELSQQYEGPSLLSPTSTFAEFRALEKHAQSQRDIFHRTRAPNG